MADGQEKEQQEQFKQEEGRADGGEPLDLQKQDWFPSHKYFIAGTWANFSPLAMHWDGDNFVHVMTVGSKGWESFQILQGGFWDKTYYPSVRDGNPFTKYVLMGPDNQGNGKNWTMGMPPDRSGVSARNAVNVGEHYRITVRVDGNSMVTEVTWKQLEPDELKASMVKELGRPMLGPRRILVLRHGSRPNGEVDPSLDLLGFRQAGEAARYLGKECTKIGVAPITAIFCSPFLRAMQTAAPVAQALNLRICVEEGFCELLAHQWLHDEDPLPSLGPDRAGLPMPRFFDEEYKSSVRPVYPDVVGRMRKGDAEARRKPTQRHKRAAKAALAAAKGGSVLVVAHGATHDFVAEALCPQQHLQVNHTPHTVDHCCITEIVEQGGAWQLAAFGECPWKEAFMKKLKKEAEQRAKGASEPQPEADVEPEGPKSWHERKVEEESRAKAAAMDLMRQQEAREQQDYDRDQPVWVCIGGEAKRGILVRSGASLHSRELPARLATGARVLQLGLTRERLHYRKLEGDGPDFGWVSIKHNNLELMRREN